MKNAIIYSLIAILITGLVATSTFAYRYYSETPTARADRENLESLRDCLDKARSIDVLTEAREATSACPQSSMKYEVKELQESTGTASLAPVSEVPLGYETKNTGTASSKREADVSQLLRPYFGIPVECPRDLKFNEDHRFPRLGIEWLAYDIPSCDKSPMDVRIPPGTYTIEKIGYGENLGNYIILKRDDPGFMKLFRIVLGHIVTSREVGDTLSSRDIIGQTNVSGKSTGNHLHVELWEGTNIVSREFMWGGDYTFSDESKLLSHRKWDFSK